MRTNGLTIHQNGQALATVIALWADARTDPTSSRRRDLIRDKQRAVMDFFDWCGKAPGQVSETDVKLWQQELTWRDSDISVYSDSFETKIEYHLTTNARLFAEYKQTHYPEASWEPTVWPFDDNFIRAYFELTF